MPKAELTTFVTPKCQALAQRMGLELVDVCLDKESAGKYLRIYLDKPQGLSLDDCESYHRAIQPQLEQYDYDFLEVSSPGVDRPLKTPRDYERHLGDEVEVKLFKAVNGQKVYTGILAGLDTAWFNPKHLPGDPAISPTWEANNFPALQDLILGDAPRANAT